MFMCRSNKENVCQGGDDCDLPAIHIASTAGCGIGVANNGAGAADNKPRAVHRTPTSSSTVIFPRPTSVECVGVFESAAASAPCGPVSSETSAMTSSEVHANSDDSPTFTIRRPVAMRPSTSNVTGVKCRMLKPVARKEVKLSSPLLRRGKSERDYLQQQNRVEASKRREQARLNELKRQERESARDVQFSGLPNLSNLFHFGFGARDAEKVDDNIDNMPTKFIPPKRAVVKNNIAMNPSASPPAILKAPRQRSVSAVLEDLKYCEEKDGNVLFFPDGRGLDESTHRAHCQEEADDPAPITSQGADRVELCAQNDEGSVAEASQTSDDSLIDETSPSLIPFDVIWQIGNDSDRLSLPTSKGYKVCSLKPKTTVRMEGPASVSPPPSAQVFKAIDSSDNTKSFSREGGADIHEDIGRYETPDKIFAVKSTDHSAVMPGQRLSFGKRESDSSDSVPSRSNRERVDSSDVSIHTQDFNESTKFSSPATKFSSPVLRRSSSLIRDRSTPLGLTIEEGEILSLNGPAREADFCTPENSSSNQQRRRIDMSDHMPQLPELMQGLVVSTELSSPVLHGPSPSTAKGRSTPLGLTIEKDGILNFNRRQVLEESDFCTPDHSTSSRQRKRLEPSEHMPQLPELVQGINSLGIKDSARFCSPDHVPPTIHGSTPLGPTAGDGTIRAGNGHALALEESDFCTPDHSAPDGQRKRLDSSEPMPKLPELSPGWSKLNFGLAPASQQTSLMKSMKRSVF